MPLSCCVWLSRSQAAAIMLAMLPRFLYHIPLLLLPPKKDLQQCTSTTFRHGSGPACEQRPAIFGASSTDCGREPARIFDRTLRWWERCIRGRLPRKGRNLGEQCTSVNHCVLWRWNGVVSLTLRFNPHSSEFNLETERDLDWAGGTTTTSGMKMIGATFESIGRFFLWYFWSSWSCNSIGGAAAWPPSTWLCECA